MIEIAELVLIVNRVNGFFFFSSLGVIPGVLVDTLSLCSGNFCVECVLIVLNKFYIELYKIKKCR